MPCCAADLALRHARAGGLGNQTSGRSRKILQTASAPTTNGTKAAADPRNAYVAVCAIIKDQHLDLLEWIEWHKCLGVQRFYIYDNNSSMPLMLSIWEYIEAGVVQYSYFGSWPLKGFAGSTQRWAYHDCITRYKAAATTCSQACLEAHLAACTSPSTLASLGMCIHGEGQRSG
jgi:hypothetical protein